MIIGNQKDCKAIRIIIKVIQKAIKLCDLSISLFINSNLNGSCSKNHNPSKKAKCISCVLYFGKFL